MTTAPRTHRRGVKHGGEISNVPLGERIADQLRDLILDGVLAPGAPLVETSLAAELGVSRAPVRQALRILGLDGLVETVPYRGTTVRGLDRRDVEELLRIRTLHEGFAIRCIVERGDHSACDVLYACCDEMATVGGDVAALNRADARFHASLIEVADHALLITLWRTISMQVRHVMAMCNRRVADARVIAAHHRRIVDAIAAGEDERATMLLEAHVRDVIELVLREWSEPDAA